MAQAVNNNSTHKGTFQKVLRFISRYQVYLANSLLLSVIMICLTLYIPILIGKGIDMIVAPGNVNFTGLWPLLIKTGILVITTALFQWLISIINYKLTFNVIRDVRKVTFEKIQILPLQYLDTHAYGQIVSRMIADVDQFADGLLMGFSQLFTGILTITGTLVFMLATNWKIALIVVLLTPLSLFVTRFIATKTYSMFRLQTDTRAEQTALIDEMIGNQKIVQTFSHEEQALFEFEEINERLETCSLRATFFSSITNPSTRFINSVVYAGVGFVGALISIATSGAFTIGQLSLFLSYANQYTKPFNEISGVITELQNAFACAARVFELVEETPQIPDTPNALKLSNVDGNLKVENVSFSYVPEKELIKDFNLSVMPGQRIAIVGPTGCGKTTIINLLMRFYDVESGSICVEGIDIRSVTRKSLRQCYGMVLQDTWLKAGTIRDNIVMGKPDASEDEIINAAKATHAHGFIKRLSNGYDTVISEDGGSLSHGQKQLLCITRVMLCLPPMLILDEATSSIDTRTEKKIQATFEHLMQGRTSFIVAHRLSTIRNADIILVMKDGNIIEKGNHNELLSNNGFYAELYHSQFAV